MSYVEIAGIPTVATSPGPLRLYLAGPTTALHGGFANIDGVDGVRRRTGDAGVGT